MTPIDHAAVRGRPPAPGRQAALSRLLTASTGLMAGLFLAQSAIAAPSHSHGARHAATHAAGKSKATAPEAPPEDQIIAVVNGQVLTEREVDNRGKLFALSTGLSISPELMKRMRPQIVHQLIDERIKTQEILKRHINIPPEQIANAIAGIEQRNGMPKNALRDRLSMDGVALTTLIDQIRVQIGWMQVLREQISESGRITAQQITQREAALRAEEGRAQYNVSEIFIPVADPRHDENELEFTKTIIGQLREGAPFPIVAAQFSQSQTALNGGTMGWVQEDSLDPPVAQIVKAMPIGAISNPIRVPGGFVIATVAAKRTVGHQNATVVSVRQAFFPFDAPLNPQAPTDQQKQQLERATSAAKTLHSCDQVAALNTSLGMDTKHPSDPGPLILDRVPAQMRDIIEHLQPNQLSRPIVSGEGIAILMVCSRDQKNLAQETPSEIADGLLNERVEQASRQLTRDLERRSIIQMRPAATAFMPDNKAKSETNAASDTDDAKAKGTDEKPANGDKSAILNGNAGKKPS